MNVAVGRLQLSLTVVPTQPVREPALVREELDLERAFRADRRHRALQAERDQAAVRYRALGGRTF